MFSCRKVVIWQKWGGYKLDVLLILLSCLFNHHAVKLKYDIAVLFGVTQNGRASK